MEQHKQQKGAHEQSSRSSRSGGGQRHLPPGGGDRFSQSLSEKRGRNMPSASGESCTISSLLIHVWSWWVVLEGGPGAYIDM